jgi:hypothetical protein
MNVTRRRGRVTILGIEEQELLYMLNVSVALVI